MRHIWLRLIILIAAIVAVIFLVSVLVQIFPSQAYLFRYAFASIILLGGVFVTREIAKLFMLTLRGHSEKTILTAKNAFTIVGYLLSATAAIFYVGFSPTALLATATFSGLVLGLALQPTLGNFFAGILILASGAIRPGTQVRILTWHIPFQWAFTPGYKYFSPDQIYAGYMGIVMEVGLFFTTIITEEGQIMKLPNAILATDAAVVTYTGKDYFFNVRYEFSNKLDPSLVIKRVREELVDYPVVACFINEQSDKDYYIIKVVLNAKEKDHAIIKSEILTRLINLNRSMLMHQEASPNEDKSIVH